MSETEVERLQRRERELEEEVVRLRLRLNAGLGAEGHISLRGARTTKIGQDELYSAVEKTQMPMILTDPNRPDDPIIFVNRAFQELSGYDADELIGRNCRFLQGPETDRSEVKKIREGLAAGRDVAVEILNYRRDGSTFINDLFISPVYDHDGRVLYHFGSQTDVTGYRRDRRRIAELQKQQQAILDSALNFAIFATDQSGIITDWNRGAEHVLGWTAAEVRGSSAECLFTADDCAEQRPQREMSKALLEGSAVNERWHLRRDGTRFWASGTTLPLKDPDNRHIGFLTVLSDRTEQHLAGERLARSEARYRSLFEALDAGFCVIEVRFDAAGKAVDYLFLEVNPAFEDQTGLKDAAGKTVRQLRPDHEQHWLDTYGRVALTGTSARFEAAALGRWYDVHAFRIGEPGESRVAILFTDVSQRRKIESDLQTLTESLEKQIEIRTGELMAAEAALRQSQKMEAVGQLTGGLAHDFNNLLTGITGSLELLQARIAQGRLEESSRYVSAAQGAATRAAALTHRLLAFSRRQTLDPKATDVNLLAAGMEELIRRTVGPSIDLRLNLAQNLWTTLVDPSQLENALLNLCINARDAMPAGGILSVDTANTDLDDAAARERELAPGQYVSLFVSDTGTGMDPEVALRAFDPFFTTKPIGAGTGLGLSMIYGFTKQSGGQVRIHSRVGVGTTVRLYLPRLQQDEDAASPESTAPQRAPALFGETVLVVDDEEVVRMLVVEVLEDLGYQALQARDARAALEIVDQDARIDLLVTDVGLPGGMSGRQLADVVRVRRPWLKVLFITGFAETAAVGNGTMERGMEVLTKPFSLDILAARIRAMLQAET